MYLDALDCLDAFGFIGCVWMYLDVFGCIWMYLDVYLDVFGLFGCIWMYLDSLGVFDLDALDSLGVCIWDCLDAFGVFGCAKRLDEFGSIDVQTGPSRDKWSSLFGSICGQTRPMSPN